MKKKLKFSCHRVSNGEIQRANQQLNDANFRLLTHFAQKNIESMKKNHVLNEERITHTHNRGKYSHLHLPETAMEKRKRSMKKITATIITPKKWIATWIKLSRKLKKKWIYELTNSAIFSPFSAIFSLLLDCCSVCCRLKTGCCLRQCQAKYCQITVDN